MPSGGGTNCQLPTSLELVEQKLGHVEPPSATLLGGPSGLYFCSHLPAPMGGEARGDASCFVTRIRDDTARHNSKLQTMITTHMRKRAYTCSLVHVSFRSGRCRQPHPKAWTYCQNLTHVVSGVRNSTQKGRKRNLPHSSTSSGSKHVQSAVNGADARGINLSTAL